MSVNIRLAKPEDQLRCSELLDVLAKATSDPNEIFDSDTFNNLISNERGSLVVAEEDGKILGMTSISFNLALSQRLSCYDYSHRHTQSLLEG